MSSSLESFTLVSGSVQIGIRRFRLPVCNYYTTFCSLMSNFSSKKLDSFVEGFVDPNFHRFVGFRCALPNLMNNYTIVSQFLSNFFERKFFRERSGPIRSVFRYALFNTHNGKIVTKKSQHIFSYDRNFTLIWVFLSSIFL